jgi:hypothetical protein
MMLTNVMLSLVKLNKSSPKWVMMLLKLMNNYDISEKIKTISPNNLIGSLVVMDGHMILVLPVLIMLCLNLKKIIMF